MPAYARARGFAPAKDTQSDRARPPNPHRLPAWTIPTPRAGQSKAAIARRALNESFRLLNDLRSLLKATRFPLQLPEVDTRLAHGKCDLKHEGAIVIKGLKRRLILSG